MPSERMTLGDEPFRSTKRDPITISQPEVSQRFEDPRNIGGIVLAVAIHANHVLEAQLESQLVSGLDAAAQPQMMRQASTSAPASRAAAMVASLEQSSITSTGVPGIARRTDTHHAGDGAFLVERRE